MGAQGQVLSREELDALLLELAEAQREERAQKSVFPSSASPVQPVGFAPLRKLMDRFAAEYGKALSSAFQKRIELEIVGWDEMPFAELAEILLPLDRLVALAMEPTEDLAYVVISRPLVFEWLCLSYGGRSGGRPNPVPERPYTRIEKRFLERIVSETVAELNEILAESTPVRMRVIGIEEPRALLESGESTLLASFDMRGLASIGRIRIALPLGPLARFQTPRRRVEPRQRPGVRNAVLEMRVPVRAEVGHADLSLRRLASLQPGDVIPIEGCKDGSLIVRVGDAAKFKGVRGAVGGRLAVQVTERIG